MKYILHAIQLCLLLISPNLMALDTLHIAILAPADSQLFRAAQAINNALGNEIGMPIELHSMPGDLALAELIKGDKIQADMARMPDLSPASNMLVSKEPIISTPVFVYAPAALNINFNGWSGLQHYRISYPRDWQYIRKQVETFPNAYPVTSASQATNMVIHNRADVLIASPLLMAPVLSDSRAKKIGLAPVMPALGKIPLFTYFNKNYSELSERYQAALKKLKHSGTFARLLRETP